MKTHIFHGRRNETIEVDVSGEIWHLARDARLRTEGHGIVANVGTDHSTLKIDGLIESGLNGLELRGTATVVKLGQEAVISSSGFGGHAISSHGDDLRLVNHGEIESVTRGISTVGDR
jgi:hypothetical protein